MRLKKAQRQALLEWVAEGLQSDEINLRAAEFEQPFSVSRATITHYRKTRAVDIQRVIAEGEAEALTSGLALRSERVKKLKALALRLERDLFGDGTDDYIWTDQVKGVGSGDVAEIVEYEEFNSAEIVQYRGLLDDIAKEVGERVQKSELTGKDGGPVTFKVVYDDKPGASE
jgi:hypothetical protein